LPHREPREALSLWAHVKATQAGYGSGSPQPGSIIKGILAWLKTAGLLRKAQQRGVARVGSMSTFAVVIYHLVRMRS
jgi:hypothetical protein